ITYWTAFITFCFGVLNYFYVAINSTVDERPSLPSIFSFTGNIKLHSFLIISKDTRTRRLATILDLGPDSYICFFIDLMMIDKAYVALHTHSIAQTSANWTWPNMRSPLSWRLSSSIILQVTALNFQIIYYYRC